MGLVLGAVVGRCSAVALHLRLVSPTLGEVGHLCPPFSSSSPRVRLFFFLQRAKNKPAKGQNERMTRMPRNQLLDVLFALFREREQWPIKLLREKTQQPEVYLKEVLSEIATLHRNGEFNGTWELMPSFKGDGVGWSFLQSAAIHFIFPCAYQGRWHVAAVCVSNV